jgi:short-subunit dehydrogenase
VNNAAKLQSNIALITGASSGFGIEFSKLFASDGYDLIITGKPGSDTKAVADRITKEYGVRVWFKEFDLSKSEAPKQLYDWIKSEKLRVSVLVNNAGIGLYGRFTEHSINDEKELINLNVTALSELCHLFIPDMIKAGRGKILNVASIAGFQAGPFYATYFASKSYVLLFSEALYYEYASKNIVVTVLCPGVARTKFFKRANMRENSKLLQFYMMEAEAVTKSGYRGLMNNKRLVIPGTRNKVVGLGYRILPRSVINKITKDLIRSAAE